jgi:hypothetical protein
MPRNPHKTLCAVPGCRAWAVRGSDPPRCAPHRHAASLACPESTGDVLRVEPAEPGPRVGAPPGNQNRLVHGFYAEALHPRELADLGSCAADSTLDAEIAVTRVALRRILGMLLTGVTPGPNPHPLDAQDYARFVGLAFQGASTISRLLRARHDLPGDEPMTTFLDQILDDLGSEWGIQL